MGRLTREPEIRHTEGESGTTIARYTLAVDRRYRKEGQDQTADFPQCIAFGKSAEFAEKYLHQGMKILVTGRLQTGSYTNREGQKVYTTDVVVEDQEFAESKAASENRSSAGQTGGPAPNTPAPGDDSFMSIPDGIDEELPFN